MKILLPIANWDSIPAQVEAVLPYSHLPDTRILLTHIIEPLETPSARYGFTQYADQWIQKGHRRAEMLLAEATRQLVSSQYYVQPQVDSIIIAGDPIDELVDMSWDKSIDLIVLAKRSRHFFLGLFTRSVSSNLSRKAKCSMLVVKTKDAMKSRPSQNKGFFFWQKGPAQEAEALGNGQEKMSV